MNTKIETNPNNFVIENEKSTSFLSGTTDSILKFGIKIRLGIKQRLEFLIKDERGDVPGWVLVVLMTTGLVTAIWAIAKPNLTNILNNSLNSMNGVR